jgi:hypothetical protein
MLPRSRHEHSWILHEATAAAHKMGSGSRLEHTWVSHATNCDHESNGPRRGTILHAVVSVRRPFVSMLFGSELYGWASVMLSWI